MSTVQFAKLFLFTFIDFFCQKCMVDGKSFLMEANDKGCYQLAVAIATSLIFSAAYSPLHI